MFIHLHLRRSFPEKGDLWKTEQRHLCSAVLSTISLAKLISFPGAVMTMVVFYVILREFVVTIKRTAVTICRK